MPGFCEILIAPSAASTLRDQHALARRGQVGDGFARLFVVGERADGNLEDHVRAGVAGAIRAFAMASAVRFKFAIVPIAQQSVVVGIRFQINAAAMAAVASGWAAARNEFLASKRNAAVAAVARFHQYFCFINKHENDTPREAAALRPPLCRIAEAGNRMVDRLRRAGAWTN